MQKFLTAEWQQLAMLNYKIDPAILQPFVPLGTEIDFWQGDAFVSMVGFWFCRTKVLGIPIPFHQNFEEVNLRFYVRYKADDGWRRGVVFIKEIVPRFAIAAVARIGYNENYVAMPMRHKIQDGFVEYNWQKNNRWDSLQIKTIGVAQPLVSGSTEEFITEHYWGYAKQRNGSTVEYRVEHPTWNVWQVSEAKLACDVEKIYGNQFCEYLNTPPASAFLAEGSPVIVYRGVKI